MESVEKFLFGFKLFQIYEEFDKSESKCFNCVNSVKCLILYFNNFAWIEVDLRMYVLVVDD